jgi:regulation of enolase protein 1 (concanavalin A-like superfamily)
MNEPGFPKISGTQILVDSRLKTDFWRKTFFGITGHRHCLPLSVVFTRSFSDWSTLPLGHRPGAVEHDSPKGRD